MANVDFENNHAGNGLQFIDMPRLRLSRLGLRFRSLWPAIRGFGHWLEHEALPAARNAHQGLARIRIGADGSARTVGFETESESTWGGVPHDLSEFLLRLNIRELQLDPRLESNQIEDVLTLLYACRRALSVRNSTRSLRGVAGRLVTDTGVHIACTQACLKKDVLVVAYSYCVTPFSRTVRWFERKSRQFSDHRALFHAAPRYALIVGLVAVVPFLVYATFNNWWLLLAVTVFGAGALLAMTYMFFMIVGSVEYDNEEKAYRLGRAYEKLKLYADRIHDDVIRARSVQERILPNLSDMPLADRIEWAGSFVPAAEVGGDYFDAHAIGPDHVAIMFADVSGHGMAAAFITAILKTTFQDWVDDGQTLKQLIHRLNHTLCRFTPDDSYAAVFAATYNAATGELTYANCGHQPEPWRLGHNDEQLNVKSLSDARNLLLGVEDEIHVVQSRLHLKPGDAVLFVSDGLVEAVNDEGQRYGTDEFEAFLRAGNADSARKLVETVVTEIASFAVGTEPNDDRTVLAFRIKHG